MTARLDEHEQVAYSRRRRRREFRSVALLAGCLGWACGGQGDGERPDRLGTATEPQTISIALNLAKRLQTLEGFGASIAWYDDWLTQHPNSDELYDVLFRDLGLDILRLRNRFRYDTAGLETESFEIVERAQQSLGRAPTILLSSWTPPVELKANGRLDCEGESSCTLIRQDGEFPYERFAEYWLDSLEAYADGGIEPKFISIQNEPDFIPTGWEGCRFVPTESLAYPGYAEALDAVAERIEELASPPGLLGPETLGIHYNRVLEYGAEMDLDKLAGIAHHLYEGESWRTPDGYVDAFGKIAESFPQLPVFQTEFSNEGEVGDEGAFETAWLIQNALTEANAAAYLYWDLLWPRGGLVTVEHYGNRGSWRSAEGYSVRPHYYSLKHFAYFTDPGYVRVESVSSWHSVRASAFLSPDSERLVVVLLNVGSTEKDVELDLNGFEARDSSGYRSTETLSWKELDVPTDPQALSLPGRSVSTLVFYAN